MKLYLNSSTDYKIVDEANKEHSIEQAKKLMKEGKVSDCNLAFQRLVNIGWDIEALKRYYEGVKK